MDTAIDLSLIHISGWGPKLMMALFALLITGFVGLLFGMGFMGTVLYLSLIHI